MSIIMKFKQLISSLLFYPAFIIIYFAYSLCYKLSCLIQYLFTVIYIQHICGFKKMQKIISGINSLNKIPENITVVFSFNKFQIQKDDYSVTNQQIQRKIIKEYVNILNQIHMIKNITIFIDSQSQHLNLLVNKLEDKINQISSQKNIKIMNQQQKQIQQIDYLPESDKSRTPFIIIYSNYQTICNIPSKYLVNAQIAFNTTIFNSTKYDIYKSFQQYSQSKQRNGK